MWPFCHRTIDTLFFSATGGDGAENWNQGLLQYPKSWPDELMQNWRLVSDDNQ